MQSHVHAGKTVEDIPIRLNPGGGKPFAVLTFGLVEITAESTADCDTIIKAAAEARDLLSPIWVVVDSLEGKVSGGGPMTHADAEAWIKANGSYFVRELAIERALDANIPPAQRDPHGPNAQLTPPGHQLPAAEVPEDAPPHHAKSDRCLSEEAPGGCFCTAQEGHAGPLHIAYGPSSEIVHSWPVAEVPAGSDA